MQNDEYWMTQALAYAIRAEREGEVPIGAVLVKEGQLLAEGWNQPICGRDPSAHAEIMALRKAAHKLNNYRLPNTTLYVTVEPCAMCAGALVWARVERLVFGTPDVRAGAVVSVFKILDENQLNHRVQWQGGILKEECRQLLQSFFKKRRV